VDGEIPRARWNMDKYRHIDISDFNTPISSIDDPNKKEFQT
jgi:hypothetical protein